MAKKAAKKKVVRRRDRPVSPEVADLVGEPDVPLVETPPAPQHPVKPGNSRHKTRTAAKPQGNPATKQEGGADSLPAGYRMVGGVPIPPYPRELATIVAGHKSPGVKEWYRKNHPEAYKALFQSNVG